MFSKDIMGNITNAYKTEVVQLEGKTTEDNNNAV
jgi:hypothetical protein